MGGVGRGQLQKGQQSTDCEVVKTAVFSSGNIFCHYSKVRGFLNDIAVAGDHFWIYGLEEEGVIVLSAEAGQPHDLFSSHTPLWPPRHHVKRLKSEVCA
jgi:hypothetical protein